MREDNVYKVRYHYIFLFKTTLLYRRTLPISNPILCSINQTTMEPNECGIQDLEVERVERRKRSSLGQCTDGYLCERGCRLSAEHGLLKIYLFPFF